MKTRIKLVIRFTAIVLFSGAMGFTAVDGILRTSRLTIELFEYPLMASSFARSAQTVCAHPPSQREYTRDRSA